MVSVSAGIGAGRRARLLREDSTGREEPEEGLERLPELGLRESGPFK